MPHATSVEDVQHVTIFSKNICINPTNDLGKSGQFFSQSNRSGIVRNTPWRTPPFNVLRKLLSIWWNLFCLWRSKSHDLLHSAYQNLSVQHLTYFLPVQITLKSLLFSSIPTSCSKTSSYSNTWLKFSWTSSLLDITLFNLFEIVSNSHLSHWSSFFIFQAYSSAPLPNSSPMRATQPSTAHNISLCSISWNVWNSTDSSSVPGKALSVRCCCTALPTYTSRPTVNLQLLRLSNLTQHLAKWCWRLNNKLFQDVQCGCKKICINTEIECMHREAEKVSRLCTQNALSIRHSRYKQTESPSISLLEHNTMPKLTNLSSNSTWQQQYDNGHCTPHVPANQIFLGKQLANYKYYSSDPCRMENIPWQTFGRIILHIIPFKCFDSDRLPCRKA